MPTDETHEGGGPAGELPKETASLFLGPPEEFIAGRNALATRLRKEGRSAEASAVAALRKPTVVAWALNQLAARDADGVRALADAGAEVRAAQQAALSSKRGAADRLRTAGAARKRAVADLAGEAVAALERAGRASGAHADAIVHALEACSVDEAAMASLASGTFERPPSASGGFGDVFGLTSVDGGLSTAIADGDDEPAGGDETPSPRNAAAMAAEVARLRRDRDAASRRARKAQHAAEGFAHELDGMRRRLEIVERKHADAAAAAAEGELEVAKAERALRRATEGSEGG